MATISFKRFYGESISGLVGNGYLDQDAALPLSGDAIAGAVCEGLWYDAALQVYGDAYAGMLGEGFVEVTEGGEVYEVPAFGEGVFGLLAGGVLFIDPDESLLRRYWSESDYQLGGSAVDCGNTAGSVEGEGNA